MMRIIGFDIWGDYAHFKKNYVTTSPLTFSIPPRATIAGLIAAIAGIKSYEYPDFLSKSNSKIALKILKPIKKTRISISLISTKREHLVYPRSFGYFKQHTLINFEMLRDPKCRIYFYHKDEDFMEEFENMLKEHKSVYTPFLGLSELICNFKYTGTYDAKEIKPSGFLYIESVIPLKSSVSNENKIKIEPEYDKKYILETMPSVMTPEREVKEYVEVLIEEDGKPIKAFPNTYWKVEDGSNVIFL